MCLREVAVVVAVMVVAVEVAGCGGDGAPSDVLPGGRRADRDPPESELVVRLTETVDANDWTVAVYRWGACRLRTEYGWEGDPVGYFETQLGTREMRHLRQALQRLAAMSGNDASQGCIPGTFWLEFRVGGELRTLKFGHGRLHFPRAVRTLYEYRDWPEERSGLLWGAAQKARRHPTSALALSVATDKLSYAVGEPVSAHLTVTNVGSMPAAYATMVCRDLVFGDAGIHLCPPRHGVCTSQWVHFGAHWRLPELHALTPSAREDLANIIVLNPGQQYAFDFPETLQTKRATTRNLIASVSTYPRYDLDAINAALPAPLIVDEFSSNALAIEVHE